MSGVVVVGSGVAGVRAAESLKTAGYAGQITIIGDESPFYRPAVSKEALLDPASTHFPMPLKRSESDFNWRSPARVETVDLQAQHLTFIERDQFSHDLAFDGLVIASGLRSRPLALPGLEAERHTLRTLHDAQALSDRLTSGVRVTIIGSGFVGCEVAAAARSRGCKVFVVSPEPIPLAGAIGETLATLITQRHLDHGVQFVYERGVREFRREAEQCEVVLDSGRVLVTDIVLEAVGSLPNVEWLTDTGLDTSNGVAADSQLRALGTKAPIVVCGDIARHPNALYPGQVRRIEHWTVASDSGAYAGRALHQLLEAGSIGLASFAALPSFWSDQYDMQLQSFGLIQAGARQEIIELNDDGSCIVEFHDDARLVAVAGINRTAQLAAYRKELIAR